MKADAGCITAPPTTGYCWVNCDPVGDLSKAWIELLTRERRRTISERAVAAIRQPTGVARHEAAPNNRYGAAALEREIAAVANVAPGGRNHALNRASFNLFQLVGGNELDGGEVRRRLIDASRANGLAADDGLPSVIATIESGMCASLANRRRRPT